METLVNAPVQVTVRARAAAIAWYNAFLASGTDEGRPAIYQTLSLEFYLFGIQFIGCDGTALFRTWVPTTDNENAEEPSLWPVDGVKPLRSVVVMDPEGFGLGYMRTLMRVTGDDAHAFEELTITTAEHDDEVTPMLGDEFKTERLILRACGQRIDLRLMETPFPDWRHLNLGVAPIERVDGLKVATRLFGLVSKLKGVSSADLDFHGDQRHVGFTGHGDTEVRGVLMPMRRTT
jgi:hypothetical protein